MNTVKMLALREWMQHGRAWLLLAAVPLGLAVLALAFGHVDLQGADASGRVTPALTYYVISGGYLVGMGVLVAFAALIQAQGLARRDRQDRSIEFWLSLPVGHWRAVLVPMLMLLVGLPIVAMLISLAATPVLAGIVAWRFFGAEGLAQIGWGSYLVALLLTAARLALGIVVGALWVAPLVAVGMAVNLWLKRWGTAVFFAVVFLGALILDQAYGIAGPQRALASLLQHAADGYTLLGGVGMMPTPQQLAQTGFASVSAALAQDMRQLLAGMATLPFLGGLAVAALGVWAQVWQRGRG